MQILNKVKHELNFSFAKHTTYGLGGLAKIAYFPQTVNETTEVYDFVKQNHANYTILGNGSNVLVADGYYDGAVICTNNLSGISYENGVLNCLSGTTVKKLLQYCIENGLEGLEYLAGIPASVGGLVLMNGGINCTRIETNVEQVTVYNGHLQNFSKEDCNFGNKHSTMRDINAIILSIELNVKHTSPQTVRKNVEYFMNLRKLQPKGKSCGCVFKNPECGSAGRIIDEAGLKGLKIGGAEVSAEHANFIINNGDKASDVYRLICEIKRRVYERFGKELEEEVVYIGKFNETDG